MKFENESDKFDSDHATKDNCKTNSAVIRKTQWTTLFNFVLKLKKTLIQCLLHNTK